MKLVSALTAAAMVASALLATPALADKGRGHGKGPHHAQHDRKHHRGDDRHAYGCPPGLAKKHNGCQPPGQAKNQDYRHSYRIGDVFRVSDYTRINDPYRYRLEQRPGWNYYSDGQQIYRVDSDTRKVLAVLNLITAFSN